MYTLGKLIATAGRVVMTRRSSGRGVGPAVIALGLGLLIVWGNAQAQAMAAPRFAEGTAVREENSYLIYKIVGGAKIWFVNAEEFHALGYNLDRVIVVPSGSLASTPNIPADGTLLRERSSFAVYLMDGGKRRWISNKRIFDAAGFTLNRVQVVANSALGGIPTGPDIGDTPRDDPKPAATASGPPGALVALCAKHPLACAAFNEDREEAIRLTRRLYTYPDADSTKANAFKHGFWNALMMNSRWETVGNLADDFATAHETDYGRPTSDKLGQASRMDMINNAVGRTLAKRLKADGQLTDVRACRRMYAWVRDYGLYVEPPTDPKAEYERRGLNEWPSGYESPVFTRIFVSGNPVLAGDVDHCKEAG
jgi:hypothetical protein